MSDTSNRGEFLDDRTLRNVAAPSLAHGAHKAALRRELMTEARRRFEAGDLSPGFSSWRTRLNYGLGFAISTCVVIAGLYIGRGVLFPDRTAPKGFSAELRGGQRQTVGGRGEGIGGGLSADAIDTAIELGHVELQLALPSRTKGPFYLHRIALGDGQHVTFGTDRVLTPYPGLSLDHSQEFQDAIEAGKGRFVEQVESEFGTKLYRYRMRLSDGTTETYATQREPDALSQQRHQRELDQAMAQDRGEVCGAAAGPKGNVVFIIKVALSDGVSKIYASDARPKGKK